MVKVYYCKKIKKEIDKKFVKVIKKMGYNYIVGGAKKTRVYLYKTLPENLNFAQYLSDGGISFLVKELNMFGVGNIMGNTNVIYEI